MREDVGNGESPAVASLLAGQPAEHAPVQVSGELLGDDDRVIERTVERRRVARQDAARRQPHGAGRHRLEGDARLWQVGGGERPRPGAVDVAKHASPGDVRDR